MADKDDEDLKYAMLDAFRRHDRHGDGFISRDRLQRVLSQLGFGDINDEDIDVVIAANLRGESSNRIVYQEFVDWITSPSSGTPAGLSRCSTADGDSGSGRSRGERRGSLQTARGALARQCAALRYRLHSLVPRACPQGHQLENFFTTHVHFLCDWCRTPQACGDWMLGCRACDYDLCAKCTGAAEASRVEGAVRESLAWLERSVGAAEQGDLDDRRRALEDYAGRQLGPLARPLTHYFAGGYFAGELFAGPRYARKVDEQTNLQVLEHGQSGLRVWAEALDFRRSRPHAEEDEPTIVLFWYTAANVLARLAADVIDRRCISGLLLAPRVCAQASADQFGAGVHASGMEPADFVRKGAGNGGPSGGRYCVPLVVPQRCALHVSGGGGGAFGEGAPADRDLWIVQDMPSPADLLQGKVAVARKCAEWLQERMGLPNPDSLAHVTELAGLLKSIGEYSEAEALFRYELKASEELFGPTHPDTLTSVDNLAGLLKAIGVHDEAETLYRRALDGSVQKLGPYHPDTLTSFNNLASLLKAMGRLEEAESLYRHALKGSEETLGETHPDTLTSMSNLAALLTVRGNLAEAERFYRIVLKAREEQLGPSDLQTLRTIGSLAATVDRAGGAVEAERLYARGLRDARATLGPQHQDTLVLLTGLAELLRSSGRPHEAAALASQLAEAPGRPLSGADLARRGAL